MIFKLSNTGKTITVKPVEALPGDRFKIDIFNRNICFIYVQPGEAGGHMVSPNGCISMASSRLPSWPLHGKTEIVAEQYANGTYVAALPAVLKPPKVLSARKRPVSRAAPVENWREHPLPATVYPTPAVAPTCSTTSVTMQVGARTYSFNLPQETLIDTILAWSALE